jgi:hypothetical protein
VTATIPAHVSQKLIARAAPRSAGDSGAEDRQAAGAAWRAATPFAGDDGTPRRREAEQRHEERDERDWEHEVDAETFWIGDGTADQRTRERRHVPDEEQAHLYAEHEWEPSGARRDRDAVRLVGQQVCADDPLPARHRYDAAE